MTLSTNLPTVFEARELPRPTDDESRPPKADEESPAAPQGEMPGIVAEARAGYGTARGKPKVGDRLRAPCRHCGKETPQKPTGRPRVSGGVLRQTCVCPVCEGRNDVELSVRRAGS
jgi:hypothetical protein